MVDPQTTLGEQFLDLAIGEREAQVPADREQDHFRVKLAPLEQSGNRWDTEHPSILAASLSGQASKVATLPPCVPIAVRIQTSLQCGFKKEIAVMRTRAMSQMPRLGQVKPAIFPLIAVVSGNSFFSSRTVASRTSASLGTEKCCLISTTEGMFFERGR